MAIRIKEYNPQVIVSVMKEINREIDSSISDSRIKAPLKFQLPFPRKEHLSEFLIQHNDLLLSIF